MDESPNSPIAFPVLLRIMQEWPAEFNTIKDSIEQHCHNLSHRKYGHIDRGSRGPAYLMARFPLVMRYMPRPNFWCIYPCLRYEKLNSFY